MGPLFWWSTCYPLSVDSERTLLSAAGEAPVLVHVILCQWTSDRTPLSATRGAPVLVHAILCQWTPERTPLSATGGDPDLGHVIFSVNLW